MAVAEVQMTRKRREVLDLVAKGNVTTDRTVRWYEGERVLGGADGRTLRDLLDLGLIEVAGDTSGAVVSVSTAGQEAMAEQE